MEISPRLTSRTNRVMQAPLAVGIAWGFVGGVAGTVVMDLSFSGTSSVSGLEPLTFLSVIGDTAARFFALFGIGMAGGVPLGAAVHYTMGLVFGALFGAAVARVRALAVNSAIRAGGLAVLAIEIVSQPILAAAPILLPMTASETLLWFGVAAIMHLIWAIVLGLVVYYGLRLTTAATRHPSADLRRP